MEAAVMVTSVAAMAMVVGGAMVNEGGGGDSGVCGKGGGAHPVIEPGEPAAIPPEPA